MKKINVEYYVKKICIMLHADDLEDAHYLQIALLMLTKIFDAKNYDPTITILILDDFQKKYENYYEEESKIERK